MTSYSKRAWVIGDSISSLVYENSPTVPDGNRLWVKQLAQSTGREIHNLSAPGARVGIGASPDFSVYQNLNALNFLRGVVMPDWCIVTIGTNDFPAADVSAADFQAGYRATMGYLAANNVRTLFMAPLERSDQATAYPHPDGAWPLSTWWNWFYDIGHSYGHDYISPLSLGLVATDRPDGLHLCGSGHDKVHAGMLAKLTSMGVLS